MKILSLLCLIIMVISGLATAYSFLIVPIAPVWICAAVFALSLVALMFTSSKNAEQVNASKISNQ